MTATLNAEEQAILESVDLGEWRPVENMKQEIQRYQRYAQAQMEAVETVQIKLPVIDFQALTALSEQAGVPVTSLIASVLHQYAASQLAQGLG